MGISRQSGCCPQPFVCSCFWPLRDLDCALPKRSLRYCYATQQTFSAADKLNNAVSDLRQLLGSFNFLGASRGFIRRKVLLGVAVCPLMDIQFLRISQCIKELNAARNQGGSFDTQFSYRCPVCLSFRFCFMVCLERKKMRSHWFLCGFLLTLPLPRVLSWVSLCLIAFTVHVSWTILC